MPPKYVKTIQEELFYEYAKLISRARFNGQINYGFVTDRYKEFKAGHITMSGHIREWQKEQELPRECVFCGSKENLETDHLIPKSRGGSDEPDNLVLSCKTCNTSRNNKGVFEWLGLKKKDQLHRLVAGKYLKELYNYHTVKNTLSVDVEHLNKVCKGCRNPKTCAEWDTVGELTCLCLESVF
jgi:hypothetical protein